MQQEVAHLGQILKERRQEKNLSLKEVENATSIRIHFLSAIEEGNLSKLISPVYAQGFIKKYANFLDLEGEQILKQYPQVMKLFAENPASRQEFSYGLGSVEVRGSGSSLSSEIKWLPTFLWGGLSLLVIGAGWWLARTFNLL